MKVNAEIFLDNISKYKLSDSAVLIAGNETGLISKIESTIIKELSAKGFERTEPVDFKKDKSVNFQEMLGSQSLFSSSKVIQIKNIGDQVIKTIENAEIKNNSFLINGENLKSSSKTFKYFNSHKNFLLITCYKLTRVFKKKLIDSFLNKNNISLERDVYWFLIENISDEYLNLNNDLEKIYLFSFQKKNLNLNDIKKLIESRNVEFEDLFFECIKGDRSKIIRVSEKIIRSSSDAYIVLQLIKKFTLILIKTSEQKDKEDLGGLVNAYLPSYLFRHKKNFELTIKSSNIKKLLIVNKLIQKSELLLRKNDSNNLIIMQRFLLNLSKTMK